MIHNNFIRWLHRIVAMLKNFKQIMSMTRNSLQATPFIWKKVRRFPVEYVPSSKSLEFCKQILYYFTIINDGWQSNSIIQSLLLQEAIGYSLKIYSLQTPANTCKHTCKHEITPGNTGQIFYWQVDLCCCFNIGQQHIASSAIACIIAGYIRYQCWIIQGLKTCKHL